MMKILILTSDYDGYCQSIDQAISMLDALLDPKSSDGKKDLHQAGISVLRSVIFELTETFQKLPDQRHDSTIEFSDDEKYKNAVAQLQRMINLLLLTLNNFETTTEFFKGLRAVATKLLFLLMELRLQELDAHYRSELEELIIKKEQYCGKDT